MDEDDPENSPILGKLHGQDQTIVPQSRRNVTRIIMNFRTVGNISTHLTPHMDVTDSAIISPLRQNQRLEWRRKRLYINPLTRPDREVQKIFQHIYITFWILLFTSSYFNFGIGGLVAGTTPMTMLFLFTICLVAGSGLAMDDSPLDEHFYWQFEHHHPPCSRPSWLLRYTQPTRFSTFLTHLPRPLW